MKNTKLFGYVLAVLVIFFWGITFVCTKTLLNDFSALEILFLGFIASGFCFAAWNKVCLELGTVRITKGLFISSK